MHFGKELFTMDAKTVGKIIAALRRQRGMTQSELADKLNVSNKAISKWESGTCYPDIAQFPAMAALFGVTVDYLMTEKRGIAVAGNIITDIVKTIDAYPEAGKLVNISEVSVAVGGCAPNVAIDLAKIDANLPISVFGKIGEDENGRFVLNSLRRCGINTDGVLVTEKLPTSFTDVMSVAGGERTFFHSGGANADFSPRDIDVAQLNCSIFHIGYIMLLDCFDKPDKEYGTAMARFLRSVQARGIATSVDMVTSSEGGYAEFVIPALKYLDYFIVNELEICGIFGLSPRGDDGKLNFDNLKSAMRSAAEAGVSKYVIVHAKEAAILYNVVTGAFSTISSLDIPKSEIKGSVGAGDAFCAGALYSIHNSFSDRHILEFASSAAAANLFAANSVDGMLPAKKITDLMKKYPRKSL